MRLFNWLKKPKSEEISEEMIFSKEDCLEILSLQRELEESNLSLAELLKTSNNLTERMRYLADSLEIIKSTQEHTSVLFNTFNHLKERISALEAKARGEKS